MLLKTVAKNATVNTGTIWSPTSSCLPSMRGSTNSDILNEYPSPRQRTKKLQTAETLMVSSQKETEEPSHEWRLLC